MGKSEKEIEHEILTELNRIPGVFAWKYDPNPAFDPVLMRRLNKNRWVLKGCSDIIGINWGDAFFIEVKKPGGALSPEQTGFLNKVTSLGCRAGAAKTVDEAIAIVLAPRPPAKKLAER